LRNCSPWGVYDEFNTIKVEVKIKAYFDLL